MATIKILNGTIRPQTAHYLAANLVILTTDGGRKTYAMKQSVKKIAKISENKGDVVFDIELWDGSSFRGETANKIFHELSKYAGNSPSPNFVNIQTPEKRKKQDRTVGWITGIAVLFVLYGCLSGEPNLTKAPMAASEDKKQLYAWTYCHQLVKNSLKSPKSASFPWAMDVRSDGSIYAVHSYVDATNSFGAEIRTFYICRLSHTGNSADNGWTVEQFDILD